MRGNSFILHFTALTMPMMAKTNRPIEASVNTMLRMEKRTLIPELYVAIKRALLTIVKIHKAIETKNKTNPWLAWYLTKRDCLAPKMGASTRRPKYDSRASVFSIEFGISPGTSDGFGAG